MAVQESGKQPGSTLIPENEQPKNRSSISDTDLEINCDEKAQSHFKIQSLLKPDLWTNGAVPYLLIAFILLLFYLFVNPDKSDKFFTDSGRFTLIGVWTFFVIGIVSFFYKKINFKMSAFLMIAAGFVMRLGYVLYTNIYTRQHDVESLDTHGHISYIYYIAQHWKLPDTYDWQYCHPPLHHFICAVFYKIGTILGFTQGRIFEGIQFLTVFYSTVCLLVFFRILLEFRNRLSKSAILAALAIISFSPVFIILAGSINNDMLSILFYSIGLLYLIRWYKNPVMKNICVLALSLGLGMMTKLSCVTLAFVIGMLFIVKLLSGKGNIVRRILKKELWLQYISFAAISVPLGLWYPLRNYFKFKLPLGYVAELPVNCNLYRGNESVMKRFFALPLHSFSTNPFLDTGREYNIPRFILKCSLTGEYTFHGFESIAKVLTFVNFGLIVISLLAMIYFCLFDKKKDVFFNLVFGLNWLFQIISYIVFNVKYPFSCSMDFRYIVPTIISGVIFIALALTRIQTLRTKLAFASEYVIYTLTGLYCIYSIYLYTSIQ